MTTGRNRTRLERLEAHAGMNVHEHVQRIFYVSGGNGRGPSGHEGGFGEFLRSKGYDTAQRHAVVHFVPWDSATQSFKAKPIELLQVRECAA